MSFLRQSEINLNNSWVQMKMSFLRQSVVPQNQLKLKNIFSNYINKLLVTAAIYLSYQYNDVDYLVLYCSVVPHSYKYSLYPHTTGFLEGAGGYTSIPAIRSIPLHLDQVHSKHEKIISYRNHIFIVWLLSVDHNNEKNLGLIL